MDSGKKSGDGRVVFCYFELCNKIWGGSPATNQISGGLESSDLLQETESLQQVELGSGEDIHRQEETSDAPGSSGVHEETEDRRDTEVSAATQRRALLNEQLSSYHHEKLKTKLPADAQLVDCAKEDLQVKKALVNQMEKMDERFMVNMTKLSTNMGHLSSAISDGFSLLRGLLLPPQQSMLQPPMQHYSMPRTPVPNLTSQQPPMQQQPAHAPWCGTEYEEF